MIWKDSIIGALLAIIAVFVTSYMVFMTMSKVRLLFVPDQLRGIEAKLDALTVRCLLGRSTDATRDASSSRKP